MGALGGRPSSGDVKRPARADCSQREQFYLLALAGTQVAKNSACRAGGFPYSLWAVAPILRFIGLLNAAVWLGAMTLFTAIIGPALFGPEVRQVLRADWMPGAV